MKLDAFCHVMPRPVFDRLAAMTDTPAAANIRNRIEGVPAIVDLDVRFRQLEEFGDDYRQIISLPAPAPEDLGGPDVSRAFVREANDELAALVDRHPEHFAGWVAAVAMNDPDAAVEEAERAIRQLGLYGLGLGTRLPDHNFDWEGLEPFWAKVEELDVPIMCHPTQRLQLPDLKDYYLVNFIGNPLDSTIMIAALVFGGVLKRHPGLKFVIVHGGGFVPYQYGRFDHGWEVRPEPKAKLQELPSTYVRRLYFDIITHAKPALEYLVGEFGADHVVLGTDYPYDMGVADPVGLIDSLTSTDAAGKQAIKGGNAAKLLKIHA
jgi:aminocarboxymuconate-semialdehyde decarboxylase